MTDAALVSTAAGPVRGRASETGITEFLGIPYAASPTGERRFAPPVPPTPWTKPRDALAHGATAPQPAGTGVAAELLPNVIIAGDDYLNLNVWTPSTQGSHPVMVFIHGGSFTTGSGSVSTYDGARFARDGVVLVTINYRLGVDGFLWLGDGVPNLGLLDQIAALEWVRDNIASFGGDPTSVTIFGESAGAMSVCTLMAMPRARGLFHRAIAESGAGVSVISPDSARKIAVRLAEILGVEATRDAIATVPLDRLLDAVAQVGAEVGKSPRKAKWGDVARNLMPFEPVIDGEVLPGVPEQLIAAGAAHDVELLIGTNTDEARLFFVPTGAMAKMSAIVPRLFAWAYGARKIGAVRTYARNRPKATPGELAAAILTDGFYRLPALRLAASHPRAFVYEFAWRSGAFEGTLGACHAIELPFVFDTLDDEAVAALLGRPAPAELATRMHTAWVQFARTGDPGWAPYVSSDRASMRFDAETRLTRDDRRTERLAWR